MLNKRPGRVIGVVVLVVMFSLAAAVLYALRSWGVHSTAAAQTGAYDAEGKRNPFIPLVSEEGKLLRLTGSTPEPAKADQDMEPGMSVMHPCVQGIVVDPRGSSFAVVNDEIVKEGDAIGDYQIVKIAADRVIFQKDGNPVEVIVHKEEGT
jgi:hypothetical protein